MGKSKKASSRRKGRNSFTSSGRDPDQRVVRQTFRIYSNQACSNTANTITAIEIDLSPPQWGARGIAMADLYSKYRICSFQMQAHLHPGRVDTATAAMYLPGNATWMFGVYYGPKSTFTAPTTFTNFVDFPHLQLAQDHGPPVHLRVGQSDLKSHMNQKWMNTAATGETDPETIQLCLEIMNAPATTTTQNASADIVMDLGVEFTGSVDPALIPLRMMTRYSSSSKDFVFENEESDGVRAPSPTPSGFYMVDDSKRMSLEAIHSSLTDSGFPRSVRGPPFALKRGATPAYKVLRQGVKPTDGSGSNPSSKPLYGGEEKKFGT